MGLTDQELNASGLSALANAYASCTPGMWKKWQRGPLENDVTDEVGQQLLLGHDYPDVDFVVLAHNTMPRLLALAEAAKSVISRWESGDLAAAVRDLEDVLCDLGAV